MTRFWALVALLVLTALGTPAQAEDSWWGPDKALHLGVGAAIGGVLYGSLWAANVGTPAIRFPVSVAVGMLPAVGKEIYDATRPDNHFSGRDLFWSAVGVLGATAILFTIDMLTRDGDKSSPDKHVASQLTGQVQGIRFHY